jgi:hypothetical protein
MTVQEREHIVARQMLRDIVQCSDFTQILKSLGLVPPSPDVDEREHMASHARLDATYLVADDICSTADVAADVLLRLGAMGAPSGPTTDERAYIQAMARSACLATITHLVSTGVLVIP